MEAPNPKVNKLEYNISINDDLYKIMLQNLETSILFSCYEEKSIPKITYEQSFTLEQLQNQHKFFKMYDSIEESLPDITTIFEEKKIKIETETNYLNLILILPVKLKDELLLKLPQVEVKEQQLVSNLLSVVKSLSKKVEYLSQELNLIKSLPSIQYQLKRYLNTLIGDIITKKEDEEWLIDETLKNLNYEKDKKPKIILLYKASQDGDNINDFHKFCDNCNNTLIIIKSPNGNIFGGFTTQNWNNIIQLNNKAKEKLDNKAFLFNLNDRNIYKSKNGKGICTNSSYPIVFGSVNSFELYIQKNCLTNGGGCQTGSVFTNNTYIAGSNNFSISELEVYHII